jgi:hypothetical protein
MSTKAGKNRKEETKLERDPLLRWLSAGLSPLFKAVLYYMAMSKS